MNRAERKISLALSEAAAHHKGGMDPNQSIAKAASAHKLNPDMVERVVEGFNIAKTNSTIAKASDKTASFPIADRDEVLRMVFKSGHKKAGHFESQEEELHITPGRSLEVHRGRIDLDWSDGRKLAEDAGEVRDAVRQMQGAILEEKAQLSKLGQDVLLHETQAFNAMTDVVSYFQTSSNLGKFAQFEQEILSEYGVEAREALDAIYDLSALSNQKEARFAGEVKLGSCLIEPTPAHRSFDRLMEKRSAYLASEEAREKLDREIHEKEGIYRDLSRQISQLDLSTPTSAADLLDLKKKSSLSAPLDPIEAWVGSGKQADLSLEAPAQTVIGAAQGGITSGIGAQYGKAHEKAMERHYKAPKDQADMEMDNVKRQTILQQLMSNDEIISRMDPKHVESHYNTLLSIAPDLTLNHAVVQSFLRQSGANQSVDPFTAKQLADLQGQHTQNKILRDGKPAPSGT